MKKFLCKFLKYKYFYCQAEGSDEEFEVDSDESVEDDEETIDQAEKEEELEEKKAPLYLCRSQDMISTCYQSLSIQRPLCQGRRTHRRSKHTHASYLSNKEAKDHPDIFDTVTLNNQSNSTVDTGCFVFFLLFPPFFYYFFLPSSLSLFQCLKRIIRRWCETNEESTTTAASAAAVRNLRGFPRSPQKNVILSSSSLCLLCMYQRYSKNPMRNVVSNAAHTRRPASRSYGSATAAENPHTHNLLVFLLLPPLRLLSSFR